MSFWSSYKPGSCGSVIHYLYYYCGFNVAENCEVGSGTVRYWGEEIASYNVFARDSEYADIEFYFKGKNASEYEKNQKEKKALARSENLSDYFKVRMREYKDLHEQQQKIYDAECKKKYG